MLGRKHETQANSKVLEVDASLQGNLVFKDAVSLNINGSFEGRLETKGELVIGEHAVVKANIIGERITIAGQVTGDINALSELKLTSTARLFGNIKAPIFSIEKGGIFQGTSRMAAENEVPSQTSSRKLFLTLDEVSHYLSVEAPLIQEWTENGKFPGAKDGQSWRFEKQKVDEWIANGRIA